jgi:uncharacterized protein
LENGTERLRISGTPEPVKLGNHRNGQGGPQNHKTAVKWYRLAAEQGNASAQYNLGVMYEKGQGVPQDYKTAVKWFRLAAEQGNAGWKLSADQHGGNSGGATCAT